MAKLENMDWLYVEGARYSQAEAFDTLRNMEARVNSVAAAIAKGHGVRLEWIIEFLPRAKEFVALQPSPETEMVWTPIHLNGRWPTFAKMEAAFEERIPGRFALRLKHKASHRTGMVLILEDKKAATTAFMFDLIERDVRVLQEQTAAIFRDHQQFPWEGA